MLKSIHIRNYILIDRLDIDFQKGFSVMTGETGAGKSIILGAMNLLLGGRAEGRTIRSEQEKCAIEGHFDITGYGLEEFFSENELDFDPSDTILRRELLQSGKSRAFVNDTPITLNQLKELSDKLIDIHSQHQNLALGTQSFQIDVVDRIAGNSLLTDAYKTAFKHYNTLSGRLSSLKAESEGKAADVEYIRYQLDSLDNARLCDGEQEELEQESELLKHSEEIKVDLFRASNIFSGEEEEGVIQNLKKALQSIRSASNNYQRVRDLANRLESSIIELKDIYSETTQAEDSVHFDPERLEQISERLDLIYTLEKKHKVNDIASLIVITEELRQSLRRIESYDEEIEKLTSQCNAAYLLMSTTAEKLTSSRKNAASSIEKSISTLLIPLGIPNVQFKITIDSKSVYDISGHDDLRFMFSANKSVPLQELASIASGGEIARFMLCIKSLIAGAGSLPTIIFDEIDTGVSGAIAEKMALMMRQMSSNGRQVIAITHLPQIAAVGDYHYRVFKLEEEDGTHTMISKLEKEERIMELAKMMSGSTLTDAAINNAKALIENNGR
jgi:DNA repair protein RecN (Recombination protein N)